MVRTTRFSRNSSKPLFQQLQLITSYGLFQEYPPIWPLPLPPQQPRDTGKPTLVLDIDETLIHTVGMRNEGSDSVSFSFFLRPHAKEFLAEVRELYEVVFWTAGTASYCSAVMDALEVQVLQLPRSFYNIDELRVEARGGISTKNVNFYALSRTQTLQGHNYMKYLPMLGRPLNRVIMVDDNVRSFPLHPRNGVKIEPFLPNERALSEYARIVTDEVKYGQVGQRQYEGEMAKVIERGEEEVARLQADHALMDLIPMLRSAASSTDLTHELDHWRADEYTKCDDFRETMNSLSVTRQKILGNVLKERRNVPIPPLKQHVMNHGFMEEANAAMKLEQMRHTPSRL
ncbi:hypothetical protein, conserved [Trypanosoma brucei gambiense DAL972]|uniref:Mitochondrial import inner membrane translocase subunit TIM50 n=2 Tax=Trypanosoma brucei TaxID=5691 RepID=C9ZXU8_TRYB9|nr:hypothetical protein, conserved [Trypanosoma brucei gambiense DAL972]XP_011776515.1 hypothetical protein, conserved [Trypanosoma brucei gambiense DAL972]RHW70358.1 PTP1-interacting protein [Trypanosoma brucei equiperdum]CBH14243.1 hypothetical protein, conserved [Trypanosoma brucei gambiense DAL972]CBH14245.1 hypothetical protein, conserved [Trypanosoma brucei gambiense DAL972]|eukprot:XP_011776513.1 hypothetical protein, conserved [Trypanosoma brucei gambiense DAL972]